MIVETVVVTDSPTSLIELVNTARGVIYDGPIECKGIIVRSPTLPIYLSDKYTTTPVLLADTDDGQPFASHIDSNIYQSMLSTDTGSSTVGLIISQ